LVDAVRMVETISRQTVVTTGRRLEVDEHGGCYELSVAISISLGSIFRADF